MLDFFNLPNNERAPNSDVQSFIGHTVAVGSNARTTDVSEWKKPRGVSMVHIFCIGGGGGGGGGSSQAAGTGKGGGGGGAGSPWSSLIVPAAFVPDKLYVLPGNSGLGGAGGATGGAGTSGTASTVFIYPDSSFAAINILIASANPNTPSGGGGGGTSAAGGGAGTAAGAFSVGSGGNWGILGIVSSGAGNGGAAGGTTNGNGANAGFTTGGDGFVLGGGGGGGSGGVTNGTGGGASISGLLGPVSESFPGTTVASGVGGSGGYILRPPINPLVIFGGSGGSGINTTTGGQGGNGIWGSGGGGGGAGTTGGAGGDGGAGIVIITCW